MSFKDELNKNTKTPEDAYNDKINKIKESAYMSAKIEYKYIKSNILNKANNGQYSVANNKKCIVYYHIMHNSKYLSISNTPPKRQGLIFKQLKVYNDERYILREEYKTEYTFFIEKLKELCNQDGIQVSPIVYHSEKKIEYSIPTPILGYDFHKYNLALKCIIHY